MGQKALCDGQSRIALRSFSLETGMSTFTQEHLPNELAVRRKRRCRCGAHRVVCDLIGAIAGVLDHFEITSCDSDLVNGIRIAEEPPRNPPRSASLVGVSPWGCNPSACPVYAELGASACGMRLHIG